MKVIHAVIRTMLAAALLAAPSCASSYATRMGGGSPPVDPRGVPIGGTPAAFQPHDPNFYSATSVGSPGTGAFAGSGRARMEEHREAMAGQRPPKRVPEIERPPGIPYSY
jgi:hypothetical protein